MLLDEATESGVDRLWDSMEREFGIAKGFPGALPHLTIHLAGSYDLEATRPVVEELATSHGPFEVETTGLGVFTGETPILYVPVIRTRALDKLHGELYSLLAPHCGEHVPYYAPRSWMPHITIGHANITPEVLPALLAWLSRQPLSWQGHATTIAIGENTATSVELLGVYPFGGSAR